MRRMLALLAVLALTGCGGGGSAGERPAAERTPAEYPAAYEVARDELGALAERPPPEAVEGAEVVASTSWDSYALAVLVIWLSEHGVDLDEPRDPAADAIEEAWGTPVLVLTDEHARRYGRRLARLRPSEAKLRAYYEGLSSEPLGVAGQAMADYLDIVREALGRATGDRAVVIPVEGE